MDHYDIEDIKAMATTNPEKKLRLHWEAEEAEAKETTPNEILSDIEDGDYSEEQFDKIGYCISEEDYQEEQSQ